MGSLYSNVFTHFQYLYFDVCTISWRQVPLLSIFWVEVRASSFLYLCVNTQPEDPWKCFDIVIPVCFNLCPGLPGSPLRVVFCFKQGTQWIRVTVSVSESCLVYVVLEPLVVRLLLLAVAYKLSFSHPVAQLCVVGVESLTNLFLSIPKLRV